MNRFHLLIVLLLSIYLMPNTVMACDDAADKIVNKEHSHIQNEQHKSCCHNKRVSSGNDKECSGDCEKSCCTCAATSLTSAFNLVSGAIINDASSNYFLDRKSQFNYVSRAISDGFLDLWLIPKIG